MEREKEKMRLAAALPLFAGMDSRERAALMGYFDHRTCAEGETLLARDELAQELFVVGKGLILGSMSIPGSGGRHSEFHPGDFFGELCVFGRKPSFDTYQAAENSVILSIRGESINELIEKRPDIGIRFMEKLFGESIHKLRMSSRFLADVVQWGEIASRRVITDEQTGIYNREFLDDAMESFFNISLKNRKHLSLFMVDVDNFRSINETMGIETGNEIIRRVVDVIRQNVSTLGIIARYGGDEFAILLPEADLSRARDIAETMRREVASLVYRDIVRDSDIRVTVSIGISTFPETAEDFASFKEKADSSLYRAKQMGRNRVVSLT